MYSVLSNQVINVLNEHLVIFFGKVYLQISCENVFYILGLLPTEPTALALMETSHTLYLAISNILKKKILCLG